MPVEEEKKPEMNILSFQEMLFPKLSQEIPPEYTKCIFINIDKEFFGRNKTEILMLESKYSLDRILGNRHWGIKIGALIDVNVPKPLPSQEILDGYIPNVFINIDEEFFGKEKTGILARAIKHSIDKIPSKYGWDLKIAAIIDVNVPK